MTCMSLSICGWLWSMCTGLVGLGKFFRTPQELLDVCLTFHCRDRARIGWLPLEQWQDVTPGEIDACRLPGEKGYEEPKEPKINGGKKEGWWREWL